MIFQQFLSTLALHSNIYDLFSVYLLCQTLMRATAVTVPSNMDDLLCFRYTSLHFLHVMWNSMPSSCVY